MKKLIAISFVCLVNYSFSQSTTFDKNQEIARLHVISHLSTIETKSFQSEGIITPEIYQAICQIMIEKDGYVSCTRTNDNKLTIQLESWIPENDVLDVLNQFGIKFHPLTQLHPSKTH
jgi:hypothetical protein